ncbi:unnamed protein product [Rhizophagus irregularis]|nr:unnamed protein product [Rhizophagus irregularis]
MSRRKRSVSALLSNDEESITVRSSRKNRVISRVIDEESEESTLIIHTHDRRMVPCNFSKCNGKIVDVFTKLNHEADRDLDDNQDSEVVQDYSNPLSSSFEDYSNPLYTCSQNPLVLAKKYKMSSNSSKKIGGQPISKIWEWIIKGDPVPNSKGYYSATCSFCEFHWTTAKVAKLKRHLAYDCNKIDSETKINVLMMLTSSNEDSEDDSTTTSTTKSSKKQKSSDTRSQTCIDDHYENFPTPLVKEDQINKALANMFVCCNLPFSLIEHPFFIEFIKILRTTYNLPSRWVLTETLIIQEVSRITLKVNRIIEEENNLTIAFDGWTNSTGQSIYDYCLITEERKEYLWCSKNYSDISHHTGAFLGNEIIKIVDDIGPEKVAADAIKILQIKGRGLKSHTKTRWSTMWNCINSIVRLEFAFARVLSEHGNDIKNQVKDILCDRNFYENCRIITSILHPLKVIVGCLESRTSSLADCYIHLLSLASAVYCMPNQNIEFKNHCVIKFNERYDEFSDDLFLLAFFLHPRYHGNGINPSKIHNITVKAAQIWKNMGYDTGRTDVIVAKFA